MSEGFAWPEGTLYLYTGTATASAIVTYATDMDIGLLYGVENYQTLDTAYHNRWTGQRADVRVGAVYSEAVAPLQTMFNAKTAVHIHAKHTHALGSAGVFLYSGAIESLRLNGREGDMYRWTLTYYANRWSAY